MPVIYDIGDGEGCNLSDQDDLLHQDDTDSTTDSEDTVATCSARASLNRWEKRWKCGWQRLFFFVRRNPSRTCGTGLFRTGSFPVPYCMYNWKINHCVRNEYGKTFFNFLSLLMDPEKALDEYRSIFDVKIALRERFGKCMWYARGGLYRIWGNACSLMVLFLLLHFKINVRKITFRIETTEGYG